MNIETMRSFVAKLLRWHSKNNFRRLPWKGEKNPYKIWLSEIILQQTRADQGISYYLAFLKKFPDIQSLAIAPERLIFKMWEGLGYYNRCKNLIATARHIYIERNGIFPEAYEDILALKGIGPYTAAAIASFAYNKPYAVVDGNVKRVLTRYFGIAQPPDTSAGHRVISELAQRLIPAGKPAIFNQAIMDFGATVCKPKPDCAHCPLNKNCFAFANDRINELPAKSRVLKKKIRYFNYLVFQHNNSIFLRKRTERDIWQGLYEPFLIESEALLDEGDIIKIKELSQLFRTKQLLFQGTPAVIRQVLSHQIIISKFFEVKVAKKTNAIPDYKPVGIKKLGELPFPGVVVSYLAKKV